MDKEKTGKQFKNRYENLRSALLELFLQIKIRPDIEIDNFNSEMLEKEK